MAPTTRQATKTKVGEEDRNSISLVSRKFCDIDGITRKHVTVHTLYSNPSRLSKRFPFIESLTLKELHIHGLIVRDEDLETIAKTHGNDLMSLKISKCEGFSTDGLRHVSKTVVEKLHVTSRHIFNAGDLTLLAKNCCNSLRSLNIGMWCPNLEVLHTDDQCGDRAMLRGCNKLEKLDIFYQEGLTDVGLEYIRKYGVNLRSLSLHLIGNSNAGLVKLSKECPKLTKLKLRDCPFSKQVVTRSAFNISSLRSCVLAWNDYRKCALVEHKVNASSSTLRVQWIYKYTTYVAIAEIFGLMGLLSGRHFIDVATSTSNAMSDPLLDVYQNYPSARELWKALKERFFTKDAQGSKKQSCLTDSTMTAKFVALASCYKEAEWLRDLLINIPVWPKPMSLISVHCDSQSTLSRAYNQVYNSKSRHIGLRHGQLNQLINDGVITCLRFVHCTLHFLKFSENSLEVLKLLENSLEVLMLLENKLESMKILENKLESLKLQENQPVDGLVPHSTKIFYSRKCFREAVKE
ncbi:zinc finger, CCHC-type containing protein [Tanacetum coccineum]|uniref:Zinc finger, CCHC-type containing protein n=1 Tax=Tanacetum coccineum TaxID=301880 RepID=A0ABQ5H5Q0_9ASTR